jgi:hypothetical protein
MANVAEESLEMGSLNLGNKGITDVFRKGSFSKLFWLEARLQEDKDMVRGMAHSVLFWTGGERKRRNKVVAKGARGSEQGFSEMEDSGT